MDQEPENQLAELRRYVAAQGWTAVEYVDRGVSGAKDKRPALDELVRDAKRRRFDVLVCWRLDRLGRNLRAPDSAARRVARRGRGIRQPCRGDRRDDACRQAPAARARRDRRVRAGEDCRTRPGRLGAGRGARSDARATQARAWSRAADDRWRATRSRGSAQTWRLTLNTPTLARPTRARVDSLTLRFRCCLKGLTGCHLDGQNHVGSTACALGRSSVGRH